MLVWYVIQVINGREDVMRERIECMASRHHAGALLSPISNRD